MTLLEKAIELAVRAHDSDDPKQIDEDGLPHIIHCIEVMIAVREELDHTPHYHVAKAALAEYTVEELLIAAVLHDVVEDTIIPLKHIEMVFGARVASIVDALSRRVTGVDETKEYYRDFIYRCMENAGARLIKLKDLNHNMGRTHKISAKKAKWRKKLEYKYHVALSVILEGLTWEQASWHITTEGPPEKPPISHYFIADPNGKEIEVDEAEFKRLVTDAKRLIKQT